MQVDGEVGNVFPKRNFDMICNFELKIGMVSKSLSFHFVFIKWLCSFSVLFFNILYSNMNKQNLPVLFTISELQIINSAFKTQQVASISYNCKNLASMLLCKSDYISQLISSKFTCHSHVVKNMINTVSIT